MTILSPKKPLISWTVMGIVTPVIHSAAIAILVFMLASSGIAKLLWPMHFYEALLGWGWFTPKFAQVFAIMLPWIELVAAAGLLIPKFRSAALSIALILGGAFVAFQAWAWISGLNVPCGCSGLITEDRNGKTGAAAFLKAAGFMCAAVLSTVSGGDINVKNQRVEE